MTIEIRQIKAEDINDVRKLIDDVMEGEFSKEKAAYANNDLDDPSIHNGGERETLLVAEEDGIIVGTVAIKQDGPDTALLRRIFVRREYRGKGYGERLLSKAMEFCFANNYKNVTFRGTDRMQNALKLCLKNGFERETVADLGDFNLVALSKKL